MKATILTATAAIALATAAALPASAVDCKPGEQPTSDGFGCEEIPTPQPVPEPAAILGSFVVGGALLGQKVLKSKKAS